jgi:hypothetical protein
MFAWILIEKKKRSNIEEIDLIHSELTSFWLRCYSISSLRSHAYLPETSRAIHFDAVSRIRYYFPED